MARFRWPHDPSAFPSPPVGTGTASVLARIPARVGASAWPLPPREHGSRNGKVTKRDAKNYIQQKARGIMGTACSTLLHGTRRYAASRMAATSSLAVEITFTDRALNPACDRSLRGPNRAGGLCSFTAPALPRLGARLLPRAILSGLWGGLTTGSPGTYYTYMKRVSGPGRVGGGTTDPGSRVLDRPVPTGRLAERCRTAPGSRCAKCKGL